VPIKLLAPSQLGLAFQWGPIKQPPANQVAPGYPWARRKALPPSMLALVSHSVLIKELLAVAVRYQGASKSPDDGVDLMHTFTMRRDGVKLYP
jgi:hypothetical protein